MHVMFFTKIYGEAIFCGHNSLTEGVFVTQLFGNVGISVRQFVWVTANCCFLRDKINS